MKIKLFQYPIIIMLILALNPVIIYAVESELRVHSIDKVVYPDVQTKDIISDFKDNSFRASNFYDDSNIALIGKVKYIAENGSYFDLDFQGSNIKFSCVGASSEVKQQIEKISVDDNVIICGVVKTARETLFEVKPVSVWKIENDTSKYSKGYSCINGTTFFAKDWSSVKIGNWEYKTNNQWSNEKLTLVSKDDGVQYKISDNELLAIYYTDLKSAKKKAGINYSWWEVHKWLSEDSDLEEYYVAETIQHRLTYKISSEEINDLDYRYYMGSSNSNNAEVYFFYDDNSLTIIAYECGKTPTHAKEVAYFLGSMKNSQ